MAALTGAAVTMAAYPDPRRRDDLEAGTMAKERDMENAQIRKTLRWVRSLDNTKSTSSNASKALRAGVKVSKPLHLRVASTSPANTDNHSFVELM